MSAVVLSAARSAPARRAAPARGEPDAVDARFGDTHSKIARFRRAITCDHHSKRARSFAAHTAHIPHAAHTAHTARTAHGEHDERVACSHAAASAPSGNRRAHEGQQCAQSFCVVNRSGCVLLDQGQPPRRAEPARALHHRANVGPARRRRGCRGARRLTCAANVLRYINALTSTTSMGSRTGALAELESKNARGAVCSATMFCNAVISRVSTATCQWHVLLSLMDSKCAARAAATMVVCAAASHGCPSSRPRLPCRESLHACSASRAFPSVPAVGSSPPSRLAQHGHCNGVLKQSAACQVSHVTIVLRSDSAGVRRFGGGARRELQGHACCSGRVRHSTCWDARGAQGNSNAAAR